MAKPFPIQRWIDEVGSYEKAAKLVGVSWHTVKYWYYRRGSPSTKVMIKLITASKGRLTFESILDSTRWQAAKGANRG